ncbi:hypothetical protein [Rhizobium phage RHph_X2_26]|nr:hypothetical protein [Rhizobium phage RHph_X2_26]
MIKALEWSEKAGPVKDTAYHVAESGFGREWVIYAAECGEFLASDPFRTRPGEGRPTWFPTLEAAQAAVQGWHNERVKSLLDLPGGDAVEAGAMILADWLGLAWDGLADRDISDMWPDWSFDGLGRKNMQGGQPALRKVAARVLALLRRPQEPYAWTFELAGARNRETGEYCNWAAPQLSFTPPCAGKGQRNVRRLYLEPVKGVDPVAFENAARALVPFSYGAFEEKGTDAVPFEAGKPRAACYNAVRAVMAALGLHGVE